MYIIEIDIDLKTKCKHLWYIILQFFTTLIYVLMVYTITGQPLELSRISKFFSICLICAFIAESIGLSIASILNMVVRKMN